MASECADQGVEKEKVGRDDGHMSVSMFICAQRSSQGVRVFARRAKGWSLPRQMAIKLLVDTIKDTERIRAEQAEAIQRLMSIQVVMMPAFVNVGVKSSTLTI